MEGHGLESSPTFQHPLPLAFLLLHTDIHNDGLPLLSLLPYFAQVDWMLLRKHVQQLQFYIRERFCFADFYFQVLMGRQFPLIRFCIHGSYIIGFYFVEGNLLGVVVDSEGLHMVGFAEDYFLF